MTSTEAKVCALARAWTYSRYGLDEAPAKPVSGHQKEQEHTNKTIVLQPDENRDAIMGKLTRMRYSGYSEGYGFPPKGSVNFQKG